MAGRAACARIASSTRRWTPRRAPGCWRRTSSRAGTWPRCAPRAWLLDAEHEGPWAFIALENGGHAPATHLLGSKNFWVVTRYNRSAYYALAVLELGERLRQLREAGS